MVNEKDRLFGERMLPLNAVARQLGLCFARWLVAELHEMGASTVGLGRIDPRWRLLRGYGKDMMRRSLNKEDAACLLARVFFLGKPRTLADAHLCLILGELAENFGLVYGGKRDST